MYIACTRATNMAHVIFYRYEEEQEQVELLDKSLERKAERYKQQDRKASRDVDTDSYSDADWLNKACRSRCGNCGDFLTYAIHDDKV